MCPISLLLAAAVAASTTTPPDEGEVCRAAALAYFEAITRGDSDAALTLVADPSDADRFAVRASAWIAAGLLRLEELATSRLGIAERWGSRRDIGAYSVRSGMPPSR